MPREVEVKSILNKAKKRDSWFLDDYRVNLYSSCSFNCLYCYIRGSKYGHNLESSLSVKINALPLLEKQLASRARRGEYGFIVMSSATDPYLNLEKKYGYTREALKLILKYRFPIHMITKSPLIERDFDLLREIHNSAILPSDLKPKLNGGTILSFSFSTLDDTVASIFEPGAPLPSLRLETLKTAAGRGFHAGVSMMPLLPFISDTSEHLNILFSSFKKAGARYVMPSTITLFGGEKADSKTLVLNAVKKHFPQLEARYLSYFKHSNELPGFYRNAFSKKMKELGIQFGLNDRIISL